MTHLRVVAEPGRPLTTILAREPRAFAWDELVALSSPRRARTAIDNGEVTRLATDVYVSALHAASFPARVDGALLWAGTQAAVSGIAALYLWDLVDEPPDIVDVLAPHSQRLYPPEWIRLRRTRTAIRSVRRRGVTVVPVELAVAFGFGLLPHDRRDDAVYRAVRNRATSPARLADAVAATSRLRARGELMRVIDSCAQGAESNLEEHGLRRVFRGPEFARFLRQHRVLANGLFYRLDMYDPSTMTAVELDGDAYHSDPRQRLADMRRDAELATVGILTVRLSNRDMRGRPEWCRQVVRDVLRSRAAT